MVHFEAAQSQSPPKLPRDDRPHRAGAAPECQHQEIRPARGSIFFATCGSVVSETPRASSQTPPFCFDFGQLALAGGLLLRRKVLVARVFFVCGHALIALDVEIRLGAIVLRQILNLVPQLNDRGLTRVAAEARAKEAFLRS